MDSICYVLSYYAPEYIRTRTLVKALKRIDDLKLYEARNSSKGIMRYFQTLWRLLAIRLRHNPNFYVLGFRGYELYWIVRLITAGHTLIYDHMMSPYDSLVYERKLIREGGPTAKFIYQYEKYILHNSNIILTDTELHKEFLKRLFDLSPSKILAIPVGADEDVFRTSCPVPVHSNIAPFEVLFYGSFLPLHGMEFILKSAFILRKVPIHFTLIGGNEAARLQISQMIKRFDLVNVKHVDWVEFETLPEWISHADIGLGGPFGNTRQAQRVITGKTFQFLAMARAVIVGRIESDCGFVDKINCLIVEQGDEKALARAIFWAFHHRAELVQIGRRGYELYQARYSIRHISETIRRSLLS